MANAKRQPRRFNVGSDTALGRMFGALNASMGQPVMPDGPRPGITPIDGVDMDALMAQFSPGGYGMGSNIVAGLTKSNPEAMKTFSDELTAQQAYDSAMKAFNTRSEYENALKSGSMTLGQMGGMLRNWWGDQPFLGKAAGAGLALGNIGGLVDNDKFGGQLGGLALGGLGSKALMSAGMMSNPGAAALLTMTGGELGALFDKLRAKREQQRGQMPQQRR